MDDLKNSIKELFLKNRRIKDGHQYTVPSLTSYPYQWLWDSCFHAIVLSHMNLDDAKEEIRSLISKQLPSGLFPHIIYWERGSVLNVNWGNDISSTITQPPIIAYASFEIIRRCNDKKFLGEIYPALARHYKYLLTRDTRDHNLVGIINPDESGEDNSPRFDAPLGLPAIHKTEENNKRRFALFEKNRLCNFEANACMSNFFWVKDVAFNSYLIENLMVMSAFADELGETEDREYFLERTEMIKTAMRKFMFDDGIFWNIYGKDHKKVKVKTWAMFAPMLADVLTKKEAGDLVENYLKNKDCFWAEYLVPTVSMDEESFGPEESEYGEAWEHPNWRGPVWMASNWFLCRGLRKHGFNDVADEIRDKSIELVRKSGFREYYHPKTGEGMGAEDFTWGGLILDM